jgi:pimeloyl-ACP methyl ester carboxylesterase
VNPIFFGQAPRSLFGIYRATPAREPRRTGVVLCYPFGQEYMRAHRAFRQLAMLLGKSGFHSMCFDYYGTGDSSGDAGDVAIAEWVEDARMAADELIETAQLDRVAFVGLRLGAAVAAMAAAGRSDVEHLVLWDPAISGADYLAEILEDRTDSAGHSRRSVAANGTVGVMGYPLPPALLEEIGRINLFETPPPSIPCHRFVITSRERADCERLGQLQTPGMRASSVVVPGEGNWSEVDDYGGVLIPVALIQAIVAHLAREAA